jgi:hypothetical protein
MKLLFVITLTNDDAEAVEKLLDYIRAISGKQGRLVLGILSDVHEEMKSRVRISAGLAFDHVYEVPVNPLADRGALPTTKENNLFRQMARYLSENFHWPFLWLTSQCTPTAPDWRQMLSEAYENQPHSYFGNRMKIKPKVPPDAPEIFFMAKVGIYPSNASDQVTSPVDNPMPIEIASGRTINPRLGICKQIHQVNINGESDLISIREEALLVTGDKLGLLRAQVKAELAKPKVVHLETMEDRPDLRSEIIPITQIDNAEPDPLVKALVNGIHKGGKAKARK